MFPSGEVVNKGLIVCVPVSMKLVQLEWKGLNGQIKKTS